MSSKGLAAVLYIEPISKFHFGSDAGFLAAACGSASRRYQYLSAFAASPRLKNPASRPGKRVLRWALVIAALASFPAAASAAGVVISEVVFDPQGPNDTGREWIEIYNQSDAPADLTGWRLNPDGIGYFLFPAGFSLAPQSFVVVHLRMAGANSAADLYQGVAGLENNIGNASGFAALFSADPRGKGAIKSFVEWGGAGQTWERAAADAGIWMQGTFVDTAHAVEGNSIALKELRSVPIGRDDWMILSSPTPGAAGALSSPSFSSATSLSATSSAAVLGRPPAAALVNKRPPPSVLGQEGGERKSALVAAIKNMPSQESSDESKKDPAATSSAAAQAGVKLAGDIGGSIRFPGLFFVAACALSIAAAAGFFLARRIIWKEK